MASELSIGDVSDETLEDAAFELAQVASHIGWVDEELEEEYLAIRDHLLYLRSEQRLEDTQNPRAIDLFDPKSMPGWVTRWRLLRDWIRAEHDGRHRRSAGHQVTQPIHIRPEEAAHA